jgi:hypothetical protein
MLTDGVQNQNLMLSDIVPVPVKNPNLMLTDVVQNQNLMPHDSA